MASDYAKQLRAIRRYTGDSFTPARGYSGKRKPNFGQRMAVLKYFRKVEDLTRYNTVVYKPKRGEKAEVFRATNQTGFRKFTVGIVKAVNPNAKVRVRIDRQRPRGSQMVVEDIRPEHRQRFYEIPAAPLMDAIDEAAEQGEPASDYIEQVLEDYAPDASFFMIKSGDYFMWGAALGPGGQRSRAAERIYQLMNDYGADKFDTHDRNSSYFGNWFRGVTAFTDPTDAYPLIAERSQARERYLARKYVRRATVLERTKMRQHKDGSWHLYLDGKYMGRMFTEKE